MTDLARKTAICPLGSDLGRRRAIAAPPSTGLGSFVSFALISLLVMLSTGASAHADYFPKGSFQRYRPDGRYPFWNSTWLSLDPRLRFDSQGVPYVEYSTAASYNPVTIAAFGLLAYNRFEERGKTADRDSFLKMAQWLVTHQDPRCGCWYYDFDFAYLTLDETIAKPWISGMGQGLAISVMTRAYFLTKDQNYLRVAEQALLPFRRDVEDGGVKRIFFPATKTAGDPELVFYEEYPTKRTPSYTLNGFMFALVGLYDLARQQSKDASQLFRQGIVTLRTVVPLYDLGDGSSYDLGHLTHLPHKVHRDAGYHLIHITLLNALGTATRDSTLLWYRDHWNSYGTFLGVDAIWLERVTLWLLRRRPALSATMVLLCLAILALLVRDFNVNKRKRTQNVKSATMQRSHFLLSLEAASSERDAHGPTPSAGISR